MPDQLPISALQHLLYCNRQCALIHVERVWQENVFTAEGRVLHERAHEGPSESRPGIRIARGIRLVSHQHGLSGQADVVEFHQDGRVIPVEYKRGKPKTHRADEVQLCAQAICLEESQNCQIPLGYLSYGKTRHRLEIRMDAELRSLTLSLVEQLHRLIASGQTPPPVFEAKKCTACSLIELCVPRISCRPIASRYFQSALQVSLSET